LNEITPELLLQAYRVGVFPMAESQTAKEIFFVDPDRRGIIPLNSFHVPKKLKRIIRKKEFTVTYDTAFQSVLNGCALTGKRDRRDTWINDTIKELYVALLKKGFCHSVEVWLEDRLVGGLYGVAIGAAFFGESMFSEVSNASKVALVHLVAKLKYYGFTLLDTQFNTEHLMQFGAIEIDRKEYQTQLHAALSMEGHFNSSSEGLDWIDNFLQSNTQTS